MGGWADYLYSQEHDRKILARANELIRDALRDPFPGSGTGATEKQLEGVVVAMNYEEAPIGVPG